MRTTAIHRTNAAGFEELKPGCQVLILHEDFSAYTRAVEICRRIMERFASELDFDIKCWNFIELADPNCARHAAKTAGAAEIILFSVHSTRLPELERWLDFDFATRFREAGVLALLVNSPNHPPDDSNRLRERLEQSAKRLGMDFITLPAEDGMAAINLLPDSITPRESC